MSHSPTSSPLAIVDWLDQVHGADIRVEVEQLECSLDYLQASIDPILSANLFTEAQLLCARLRDRQRRRATDRCRDACASAKQVRDVWRGLLEHPSRALQWGDLALMREIVEALDAIVNVLKSVPSLEAALARRACGADVGTRLAPQGLWGRSRPCHRATRSSSAWVGSVVARVLR
jgi:hypothetical protein